MRVTAQDLCKDYPQEFARYIDLVRKMSFREKPDYRYNILHKLDIFNNFSKNCPFNNKLSINLIGKHYQLNGYLQVLIPLARKPKILI